MSNDIITGIDIGTRTIKVVVAEQLESGELNVLGVGTAPSDGLRNGYIVDAPAAAKSIRKALDNTVKNTRLRPTQAYLSIGGISLAGTLSTGTAYVRNSDSTITESDIEKALRSASKEADAELTNKKTLHDIPLAHHIDGEVALCEPLGMRGTKLESTLMLVHALESHIEDFVSVVEDANVEVVDVTAGPLASSFSAVSTPQKMQGCILLDIGAESTDVIAYESNTPIALKVIPIGSNDITNALAVELKVSTNEAEQIKKGTLVGGKHSQASVDKVTARTFAKLFAEVKKVVKSIESAPILPSGVLLTGGGARQQGIVEYAKEALKLPAKVVYAHAEKVTGHPELSVAYGLCIWGAANASESNTLSSITKPLKKLGTWFKQFLP